MSCMGLFGNETWLTCEGDNVQEYFAFAASSLKPALKLCKGI